MKKVSMIDDRYMRRAHAVGRLLKWPAIGALIAGGAFAVGHYLGPSQASRLGEAAGEGFARGVARTQQQIASLQRQLSISGWGTYR
jgi:hypothetical protein